MSKYEWERGTIKLPSAEFSKVRKKVQDADHAVKTRTFDHTQAFWKSLTTKQKKDAKEYDRALRAYCWGEGDKPAAIQPSQRRIHTRGYIGIDESDEIASAVHAKCGSSIERATRVPKRVQKADMNFPTNRTTRFDIGNEGDIDFDRDKSTVEWGVAENNHAADNARKTAVAYALFDALDQVRWTPGTGGAIVGNDEYNRDSYGEGDGGNYHTAAFGPVGAAEAPFSCGEYVDSKGRKVTRQMMFDAAEKERRRNERAMRKLYGAQGRVERGVPRGGEFSGRQYGSGGSLT